MDISPEDLQKLIEELQKLFDELSERLTPDQRRQLADLLLKLRDVIAALAGASGAAARNRALRMLAQVLGQLIERLQTLAPEVWRWLIEQLGRRIFPLFVGEGGGAAFLPLSLGGWLLLAALLAVTAFAGYRIYRQLTTDAATLPSGPPCDFSSPSGRKLATVAHGPVEASGTFSSEIELFNEAMNAALDVCKKAGTCAGACKTGTCLPNVSLQDFDIENYYVYHKVILKKFYCPCECLIVDPKTGEMKGGTK